VIDTGVTPQHPDLAGRTTAGYDFGEDDDGPWDESGHGTLVTGVAVAHTNNGVGIASPGWNSFKVMPMKVTWYHEGYQQHVWEDLHIAQGILFAGGHGADVENLSYGSYTYKPVQHRAIRFVYSLGVTLVGAKGNYGEVDRHYPSDLIEVIAVAATNNRDIRCTWSNYNVATECAAPGDEIYSTHMNGGYDTVSGTSLSAPLVSAVCTILTDWVGPTDPPHVRVELVRDILENTCDDINSGTHPGWDEYIGHERLNAGEAFEMVLNLDDGKKGQSRNYDILPETKRVTLSGPSPNPVSYSTVFNFSLPTDNGVNYRLEIFDISGRKIDSIPLPGRTVENGSVEWNPNINKISTGIYFAKISGGAGSSTIKFVVNR
jgi:hypothetical protein